MNAEGIGLALKGRRHGTAWMAKCPAHDDRDPSLSIRDVGGKVLVHCHAGCSQGSVVTSLKELGLWEAEASGASSRIVAEYDYRDEHGELLYQVVRLEPKSFRQRRPDGKGGWIWKKHPRQVLYRLREVLEAPIVFVVEGEKDVETLREWGFVATTNAGGAKAQWLPSYTQALAGRECILIPDKDAPGRRRVLTIARALLGHAAKLTIFEPSDPRVKDISDFFEYGHSEVELITAIESQEVNQ